MNRVERLCWNMSFCLRRNPARYLFQDAVLGRFSRPSAFENDLFNRCWGGSIWDVGASIGKFTTMLAKANPGQMVYAFEPNLNSLYFLSCRTAHLDNVTIVPCALTVNGNAIMGSHEPYFNAPPTGPKVATISFAEAIRKCGGAPAFAKLDIEGGEYPLFETGLPELKQSTLLVEWHGGRSVPDAAHAWDIEELSCQHTLLTPRQPAR